MSELAQLTTLAGSALAQLPGPTVEIDFSKGDWWVGLLFYLLIQWMRQRNGKGNGPRPDR